MEVFLGGTCNGDDWRSDFISKLTRDYFNPVVDDWNEEAQKQEIYERGNADYVLYCLTPDMIGFYSIAEVVEDSNKRPDKTIFVVKDLNRFSDHDQKSFRRLVDNFLQPNGVWCFKSLDEVAYFLNNP